MKKYNFRTVERITKTAARKAYNAGKDVLFIPCNLNPENNFYCLGIWESKDLFGQYEDFEKLCNAYIGYNCTPETGKYIAFYVKKESEKYFYVDGGKNKQYKFSSLEDANKFCNEVMRKTGEILRVYTK